MTLAELEGYFKSFEASVGQDIAPVKAFFSHVRAEEVKIAAEIEHLVSVGYTVVNKNEVKAAEAAV